MDRITPTQRSLLMSKIRGKNTGIELAIRALLHRHGYRYALHTKNLPGKPDIVFRQKKVAVFVDGDFWHGYHFRTWKNNLKPFWQEKISSNMKRDKRNFAKLRRTGWLVLRIWGHQVEKDAATQFKRIATILNDR